VRVCLQTKVWRNTRRVPVPIFISVPHQISVLRHANVATKTATAQNALMNRNAVNHHLSLHCQHYLVVGFVIQQLEQFMPATKIIVSCVFMLFCFFLLVAFLLRKIKLHCLQ